MDLITAVSRGSFPAAYYAAFGDRIFEDFELRPLEEVRPGGLDIEVVSPGDAEGNGLLRCVVYALARGR